MDQKINPLPKQQVNRGRPLYWSEEEYSKISDEDKTDIESFFNQYASRSFRNIINAEKVE